jgi:hypothetical protein
MMRLRLLSITALLLAVLPSCATRTVDKPEIPLTLRTFPAVYADDVLAKADTNRDGTITLVEWTSAGGDRRSFQLADQSRDGTVTRTELVRLGSNVKVFDFVRRYADFNKDNQLTPAEFRTGSGVSVLRIAQR